MPLASSSLVAGCKVTASHAGAFDQIIKSERGGDRSTAEKTERLRGSRTNRCAASGMTICYHPSDPARLPSAAWAAANRAIGTRNGSTDT